MTGGRLMRGVRRAGGALLVLLGLGVLAGLFAMHGVTATPSPMHASDPMVGAAARHPMAGAAAQRPMAGSAVQRPMAGSAGAQRPLATVHGPSAAPGTPMGAGHDMSGHLGAVCFALLVFGLLLAVALGGAVGLLPPFTRTGPGRPWRRGPPRPRPPSVYRLCVLRL